MKSGGWFSLRIIFKSNRMRNTFFLWLNNNFRWTARTQQRKMHVDCSENTWFEISIVSRFGHIKYFAFLFYFMNTIKTVDRKSRLRLKPNEWKWNLRRANVNDKIVINHTYERANTCVNQLQLNNFSKFENMCMCSEKHRQYSEPIIFL